MKGRKRIDVKCNLPEHRERTGDSTVTLARALGVNRATVLGVEKGGRTPSVGFALRAASHFGVPVEALFELPEGDPCAGEILS